MVFQYILTRIHRISFNASKYHGNKYLQMIAFVHVHHTKIYHKSSFNVCYTICMSNIIETFHLQNFQQFIIDVPYVRSYFSFAKLTIIYNTHIQITFNSILMCSPSGSCLFSIIVNFINKNNQYNMI